MDAPPILINPPPTPPETGASGSPAQPQAPGGAPGEGPGRRSRGQRPLFGRSLVTSAMVHGTIVLAAVLLTPGLRQAAGKAWYESSLVFADEDEAPPNTDPVAEPWSDLAAEEPPEPELVEVPMAPAPEPKPEDEPDLEPMPDADRVWAQVSPGPIARVTAPPAEEGASQPPADAPQDQAEDLLPAAPLATDPVLVRAPAPEYPPVARRLQLEGTVLLRIHVSARGELLRCEVVESSGFGRLDRAAVEAVRAWTFMPATSGGAAVDGVLLHSVKFGLEA